MDKSSITRFWSKVEKNSITMPSMDTPCWVWTAYCLPKGYGRFKYKNKMHSVHRLSWEMHNAPIPNNHIVCHICDNPSCVNPEHLFVGTQKDNYDDMVRKGRRVGAERVFISFNGKSQTATKWSVETGISRQVIEARINKFGWEVEKALTTPAQKQRGKN